MILNTAIQNDSPEPVAREQEMLPEMLMRYNTNNPLRPELPKMRVVIHTGEFTACANVILASENPGHGL